MLDLTGVLQGLIVAVVLAVLVWGTLKWREISRQYPREAMLLERFASIGARAAEQVYAAEIGAAKAKLGYAVAFVKAQCERYGITYSEQEIYALIEAKVQEYFGKAA
jgi:hypothetical protein